MMPHEPVSAPVNGLAHGAHLFPAAHVDCSNRGSGTRRYPPGCRLGATATSSLASGIALLYTMVVPCPAPRRWAQEVAMRRFWLCVLATLVTGAVGVLAFLGLGLMPVSADAKPGAFESWLAGFARGAALERAAPQPQSPLAATPENLAAAALLYRDNCAGCHGTPDAKEN